MHSQCKWCGHEDNANSAISDHKVLNIQFAEQNDQEPPVVMNRVKYIEALLLFAADHSAIYHVEQVHQNKSLEKESLVLKAVGCCISSIRQLCVYWCVDQVVFYSKNHWAKIKQGQHYDGLVKDLSCDGAPHDWYYEIIGLLNSIFFNFSRVWSFRR